MRSIAFMAFLLLGSVSPGCATIMHGGGDQSVGIASSTGPAWSPVRVVLNPVALHANHH